MSPATISPAYETELKKNVVQNFLNGRMLRLMLLQMQFMKRELLKAMGALDEVVDANRLNAQLLAVLPAALAAYAAARLGSKVGETTNVVRASSVFVLF